MTEEWVEHLAFGLKFPYLPLRDLDLSNNDFTELGVKQLCDALASPTCRLKILRYATDLSTLVRVLVLCGLLLLWHFHF